MTNFYYFIVLHHTTLLNKRLSCLFDTCRGKMLLGDIFNSVFFYSYYADSLSVPIMPLSQETNAMHAKRWWMTPPPFRNEDLELPWNKETSRTRATLQFLALVEGLHQIRRLRSFRIQTKSSLEDYHCGKTSNTYTMMTARQFHCDVPVDSQTLREIVCHSPEAKSSYSKNLDHDSHRVIHTYPFLWYGLFIFSLLHHPDPWP